MGSSGQNLGKSFSPTRIVDLSKAVDLVWDCMHGAMAPRPIGQDRLWVVDAVIAAEPACEDAEAIASAVIRNLHGDAYHQF